MFRTWGPRIAAISGKEGEVVALTLTLPLNSEPLHEQQAALRAAFRKLLRRQEWKGKKGAIHHVGLLATIEIGSKGLQDGRPHLHAIVVSRATGRASATTAWIVATWLELNPGASPLAQDGSPCAGNQDFGAWLNYILKGTTLVPTWDDMRLEGTISALLDRSHRLSAYGLLYSRRSKQGLKRRGHAAGKTFEV
jgi:hypothetical protein